MGELQRVAVSGPDVEDSTLGRIEALVRRAQGASEEERELLGEDLNTLLLQLPSEPEPQRSAALVSTLLETKALAGLGTTTMPSNIAATQALLSLGYPDALTLAPEELEALRRWERQRFEVPWLFLLLTLFLVLIVQIAIITAGAENAMVLRFQMSLRVLAGEAPAPPTLLERYASLVRDSAFQVLSAQLLAGTAAFLFTVTAGRRRGGRSRARRVFLSLATAAAVVGVLQLPADGWISTTSFVAATGAFICARKLKPA